MKGQGDVTENASKKVQLYYAVCKSGVNHSFSFATVLILIQPDQMDTRELDANPLNG